MSVIDAAGTGLLAPITVLYFTVHVGLSPTSVGTGLTVGALAALGLAPVAGAPIDLVGARPVLMGSMALAAVAFASYGPVDSWATLVVAVSAAEIAASGHSAGRKATAAATGTTSASRASATARTPATAIGCRPTSWDEAILGQLLSVLQKGPVVREAIASAFAELEAEGAAARGGSRPNRRRGPPGR